MRPPPLFHLLREERFSIPMREVSELMQADQKFKIHHPATWVPTLYFAEGIPFYAVSLMALIFYQRLGVRNDVITLTTRLLGIPWSLKPLWSPFLEMYKTKKYFVVLSEFIGGVSLGLLALCLPLPGVFRYSIAIFALVAFASSTHDIAADGIYIASLTSKQQAAYAGWQGSFYNIARFFAQGGLIILVGFFETRMPVLRAWGIVFTITGAILVAMSLYHIRMLPSGGEAQKSGSIQESVTTFKDVVVSFFQKPHIYLLLSFIFLYRLGEGQVTTIGPLFLKASRSAGGLGLSTTQFGTIYGTFGTAAFILGTILGGYFVSWLGLKRALLPLLLALNLPMAAYVYLSVALPTSSLLVTVAMSIEMFGYGFGFVGVILLMMQEIAPGKYQTAHYAFANSLMNLGLIIPGAVSGSIQMGLGYHRFFVWVLISSVPALLLSRFIPIGNRTAQAVPEFVDV